MWLRSVRRHAFARALALALAAIVSASALAWGHFADDDSDCNPALVHHDLSAHRVTQPARGTRAPEHCFICHTLRLFHGALTAAGERVTVDLQSTPYREHDRLLARNAARSTVDSRAPPATRL